MMTKTICHNGYCRPVDKTNEENHAKLSTVESSANIVVIVFVVTLIVAVICELLLEMFTL